MSDDLKARPLGRLLRLLTGVALVVEGGRHLFDSSQSLFWATLGVELGELVLYALLHLTIERFFAEVNPWLGAIIAAGPVVAIFLLSDAPGRLGTLLFVGISLLATAWRNEAGCEVMTLPGLLFGKRTHLCCLAFSPVDWVEERVAKDT